MARSARIKEVRRQSGATHVIIGKDGYPFVGSRAEVRQQIRDVARSITDLQLACLILAIHMQTDSDFSDVSGITGRPLTLAIDGKDTVDG